MNQERVVVVDGANVAYEERSEDGKPRVSNIVNACQELTDRGFRPIVIIDASLRHDVDDPAQLEGLLDKRHIWQAPADTDADYFVLETAERYDALVLSNDEFTRYRDDYAWIRERRVPFMIIHGEIELYEPKLKGDA